MRKSIIIATCLSNAGMHGTPDKCETSVKQIFQSEYPSHSYSAWNTNVDDNLAKNMIRTVGKPSTIHIDRFIADLWEPPYKLNSDRKILP